MRFLLDENFPKAVIPVLEAMGHEVDDFRLLGTIGAPDNEIVRLAKERSAVILTTDRDFFHTLGQNLSEHCGIIVVAVKQPTRAAIVSRIEWFIEHIGLHRVQGRVFQLRDRAWMVYPPFDD
jgi:predicted nuclease of predicted toxin-antitoxin system